MSNLATNVETEYEAVYDLERAIKCPACSAEIECLFVVRLLRAKVNFVSSLPRLGYVVACPECQTAMSAHVGSRLGF